MAGMFRRNGAIAEPRKARRFIFAEAKINRNAQIKIVLLLCIFRGFLGIKELLQGIDINQR